MNKFKRCARELKQILLDIWHGKVPPSEMSAFFSSLVAWFLEGTFFLDISADSESVSVDMGVMKQ